MGTSGSALTTTMTAFTATSTSTGVSAAGTESDPAGNALYAFAAIPVVYNRLLLITFFRMVLSHCSSSRSTLWVVQLLGTKSPLT